MKGLSHLEAISSVFGPFSARNADIEQGEEVHEIRIVAGEPIAGATTLTSPGSFEVESHHLGKVIVILNAR